MRPGSRPEGLTEVEEAARLNATAVIDVLAAISQGREQADSARVAAANASLYRGWGKARAPRELLGADGETADLPRALQIVLTD